MIEAYLTCTEGYQISDRNINEEVRLKVGEVMVKLSQRLGELIPVYGIISPSLLN